MIRREAYYVPMYGKAINFKCLSHTPSEAWVVSAGLMDLSICKILKYYYLSATVVVVAAVDIATAPAETGLAFGAEHVVAAPYLLPDCLAIGAGPTLDHRLQ